MPCDIVTQVDAFSRRHTMWCPGDKVLVAVSGGPDSCALLSVLSRFAPEHAITLEIVHVNHNLRGHESELDMAAVATLAASFGLPFHFASVDVRAHTRSHPGLSVEMAARELRYAAFEAAALASGAAAVALGHHADDVVETSLLNLLRGAGPPGLASIPAVRELSAGAAHVRVVRPLLSTSRAAIEEYCTDLGLAVRRDASNDDIGFLRNRIRHELLPLLEEGYNPSVRVALGRTVDILTEENAFVAALAEDALAGALAGALESALESAADPPTWTCSPCCGRVGPVEAYRLSAKSLSHMPVALQRRVLRLACERLGAVPSFERIEAARNMVAGRGGTLLQLGGTLTASFQAGLLTLAAVGQDPIPDFGPESDAWSIDLAIPGAVELPTGARLEARIVAHPESFRESRGGWSCASGDAFLDADLLSDALTVRARRAGDRFVPFGHSKETKLKELLVQAKVPRSERSGIAIVESKNVICWVAGVRADARFRVTANTRKVVWLEYTAPAWRSPRA